MPTFDIATLGGVLANLGVSFASYAGIAAILYAIGGILIRTVSWSLDKMLISLIAKFYDYFEQILGGTLFSDTIVDGMMNRIYLLVGVFVAFRLGMLLIQYIMNPSEVMEEKGGVNSLVKRAVVGLVLMIFIPTIFDIANRLQLAIIQDQVIERIIMDETTIATIEQAREDYGTGKIMAMTIFQGFWNVNKDQVTDEGIIRAFEQAEEKMDPQLVEDAGYGILAKSGANYAWNYSPILSTVVLGYVLYLVIKYCIDMVLRLFKLLILQILAPITIIEYIINGDRNEVFGKWKKSVIANYVMLFVRVFTIWFVTYVCWLMRTGIGGATLLSTDDYLLKAIIIMALLAFMMDFPKMMSDLFGLDLEQDASVKGVMGKAMGGIAAGLAVGGAVAGFGMKAAGGLKNTMKGGLTSATANTKRGASFAKGLNNPVKSSAGLLGAFAGNSAAGVGAVAKKIKNGGSLKDNYSSVKSSMNQAVTDAKTGKVGQTAAKIGSDFAKAAKEQKLGTTLKTGALAAGAAVLASNSVTKSASSGYQQTTGAVDQKIKGIEQQQAEAKSAQSQANIEANVSQLSQQMALQATVDLAARIRATGVDASSLPTAVVDAQIAANPRIPNITAGVTATLDSISGTSGGSVTNVSQAQQVITTELSNAGVSQETIAKVNNDIQQTYDSGGSVSSADAQRLVEDAYRYEYTPQAEQASKLLGP